MGSGQDPPAHILLPAPSGSALSPGLRSPSRGAQLILRAEVRVWTPDGCVWSFKSASFGCCQPLPALTKVDFALSFLL